MIRALCSILGLQAAVAVAVALGFLAVKGSQAAGSALIGGAIAIVPGAFYAWRVIRTGEAPPHKLLRAHYAAEFGKLALTFVLFGATFAWMKEVSVLPLFAAYIATLLVYWAALVMSYKF
jgi:ATP synthase protein I